jgi:hypothetical protein
MVREDLLSARASVREDNVVQVVRVQQKGCENLRRDGKVCWVEPRLTA